MGTLDISPEEDERETETVVPEGWKLKKDASPKTVPSTTIITAEVAELKNKLAVRPEEMIWALLFAISAACP